MIPGRPEFAIGRILHGSGNDQGGVYSLTFDKVS